MTALIHDYPEVRENALARLREAAFADTQYLTSWDDAAMLNRTIGTGIPVSGDALALLKEAAQA